MTPEQKFWQLLKPHVPGHVNRIENTVGVGIPDVTYCYQGTETWIELKAGSVLRDSQYIWHHQHALAGGIVYLIQRDKDIIAVRKATAILKEYILIGYFHKPWNWATIEAILKGEKWLKYT